jgi:hypothetical protein
VLYDLEQMFDGCAAAVLGAENIGHAVQERVVPVLRRHYDQFVEQVPGEKASGATPATYVLVAGFADGQPFIVDIDPHGLIGRYEEVGFHAVGSGAPMAQQAGALLAHFRMTERDVDYGVVAVVRILDTLGITSPSIGGPKDVYRITAEEATALSDKDIARVRKQVERWSDLESKALDELFDG